MPLFRHEGKIVLFVHIPKTGGTAVEHFLKSGPVGCALHAQKKVWMKSITPQHLHWKVLEKWVPEGFYDAAFCVVRNPYARIASEYRWRKQTVREGGVKDFNSWVAARLREYRKDKFICDNHIRPQVDFVGEPVVVFRLEDGLEAPINHALDLLGVTGMDLAELKNLKSNKTSVKAPLKASRQTLEALADFYREDFARFGYDPAVPPAGIFAPAES